MGSAPIVVAWATIMTIFLSTTNATTYRQTPYVSPLPLPTTMAINAVIPNTPKAENMAERINVQVAAWCHFYWKDTNKGGERFFDAKEQVVTSPRSLSKIRVRIRESRLSDPKQQ